MRLFKKLSLFTFGLIFCTSFLFPVVAAVSEDYLDFRDGETPSPWRDTRISQIGNWVSANLIGFDEMDPAPGSDPYHVFGTESSHTVAVDQKPTTRFAMSSLGKTSEELVGKYPTEDGRVVYIKRFTYAFDVAAFTTETWSSNTYFGDQVAATYQEPLWKFYYTDFRQDIWTPENLRGLTGVHTIKDMALNPAAYYADEVEVIGPKVNFYGYNINESRFMAVKDRALAGNIDIQIHVDANIWQDVFRSFLTDEGNYTYTDQVYVKLLRTTCIDNKAGLLQSGRRYSVVMDHLPSGQTSDSMAQTLPSEFEPIRDDADPVRSHQSIPSQYTSGYPNSISTASADTASSFAIYGAYLGSFLLPKRENGHYAEGSSSGQKMTMWLPDRGDIVYDLTEPSYDPENTAVTDAYISAYFDLRPAVSYQQVRHSYIYQEKHVAARITYEPAPLGRIASWQKTFEQQGLEISDTRYKTVTVAAGVRNVYVISTFEVDILVGAYYDFSPKTDNGYTGFTGLGGDVGEDIFPGVQDGTGESMAEFTFQDFVRKGLRAFSNPGTALLPLELAALCVLAMWLFWTWKAYNKSHPKVKKVPVRQSQPWAAMMAQSKKGGGSKSVETTTATVPSFMDALSDELGKKILISIVMFIVLLIVFSLVM
ncbi:MAG: hypothetical protein ACTSRS_07620 [Candidatus Helarchaeota archaeon]